MSITKRRDQLVVFRLTDQEYEVLKRICVAKGGRNLSEFARTELLSGAQAVDSAALHDKISSIERMMTHLESEYQVLNRQTERLRAK
jgi:hypothetical protein